MTAEIILQIIIFGIALAMDAFGVSVTDGLIYTNIDKKKSLFIAGLFGFMQGLMPLIGYFLIVLIKYIVGENGGAYAANILSIVVVWLAFASLIFIGGKMIIEGINELRHPEEYHEKLFSFKEVIAMGFATSIDALAVGVSLASGLSDNLTIWLHTAIIIFITFIICICGLFLSKQIVKLFKGKHEIAVIVGGSILLLLAAWIVLSHYLGI